MNTTKKPLTKTAIRKATSAMFKAIYAGSIDDFKQAITEGQS